MSELDPLKKTARSVYAEGDILARGIDSVARQLGPHLDAVSTAAGSSTPMGTYAKQFGETLASGLRGGTMPAAEAPYQPGQRSLPHTQWTPPTLFT